MCRILPLAVVALLAALEGATWAQGESAAARRPCPPVQGILYNEDDSNRFMLDPPGKMKPERLDQLVDDLAGPGSHVSAMLICCNAKNTAYDSRAWDMHGLGFDPDRNNHQPYFGDTPESDREVLRRWAHNIRLMRDLGVDPMKRMIDRCRVKGIRPWVSIRMNDVHDAHLARSPLHSRFWLEHHDYWRYPDRFNAWNDRCLDYGLAPVREHAMALVREVLERFDMDGLELDWNRFPLQFREGEELAKGRELTEWMSGVRRVVLEAEARWKHPICLAARVPARPDVAEGTGLDAVTWARSGLIDHLIVAPFWATTDFDIPVEVWQKRLEGTGVSVTAGLEIRVQAYPGGPVMTNSPELRRGAAMAMLSRGSQGVYLFNYFDVGTTMPGLLCEMHSAETLADKDRSYMVTYTDIAVPGRPIPAALPRTLAPGGSASFTLATGPVPLPAAIGEVELSLTSAKSSEAPHVESRLNGHEADRGPSRFGSSAFRSGFNTVELTNRGTANVRVERVELSVRFPKAR
jgi:hypothetical protein